MSFVCRGLRGFHESRIAAQISVEIEKVKKEKVALYV